MNSIKLNIENCEIIHFPRKRNIVCYDYIIDGDSLEVVDDVKDLGVYFDSALNFNYHIEIIFNRTLQML